MFGLLNKLKNRNGFTLIELIVVIAILGILATIAIPRFVGFQESAKNSTFVADVNTMENIINYYSLTRNTEPNTNPISGMNDAAWNQYAKDHLNDFISGGWPIMTPWGGYYSYRAYPVVWSSRDNWKKVDGSNEKISIVVGAQRPFEIIMIRFNNPSDPEGFQKALAALSDSPYKHRVYRYSNQFVIGIPVIYN